MREGVCVNTLPEIAEKKSDICTGLDLPNVDKLNAEMVNYR